MATYEYEQGLFEVIQAHAREVHGMYEVPPEVVDQIQAAIAEV